MGRWVRIFSRQKEQHMATTMSKRRTMFENPKGQQVKSCMVEDEAGEGKKSRPR